jgi:hypothetical protein
MTVARWFLRRESAAPASRLSALIVAAVALGAWTLAVLAWLGRL